MNSTTASTRVKCLPAGFRKSVSVAIATTGTWLGTTLGLTGDSKNGLAPNHAKIGVSTDDGSTLTILADMDHDGQLSSPSATGCKVSQNMPDSGKMLHPTQRPVEALLPLIRSFTLPSQIVLDPFPGSGSSCVAALQLGRNYVGIEKDEKYVKVATELLKKRKASRL